MTESATTPRVYRLLDSITVLDLTRMLPGPFCTWLLAGLGARVVSISAPGGQADGPDRRDRDRILYRNKRRLTLDLKRDEGRALCLRLAETADVVVEDFRPGVADRLGVGWEAVHTRNPRAVYCSISAFGQAGPYRSLPAHDLNCIALAGLLDLTGEPDGPPIVPATQVADLASGSAATIAILGALLGRGAAGPGVYVDTAMLDASLVWLLAPLLNMWRDGGISRGAWVLGGQEARYRSYRCRDGRYLSVGCLEPWLWQNLLAALDVTEAQATVARLDELFATRTRDEWWAKLAAVNACVAPVNTLPEALADPQIRLRGLVAETPHGPQLGLPFAFRGAPVGAAVDGGPPGGDGAAVLAELGLAPAEIGELRASGVI